LVLGIVVALILLGIVLALIWLGVVVGFFVNPPPLRH
jgi:hypothetical protein